MGDAIDLRAQVARMLALADELGEMDAAICLNEAHIRLGGEGVSPVSEFALARS
jgi:hypothetical protein